MDVGSVSENCQQTARDMQNQAFPFVGRKKEWCALQLCRQQVLQGEGKLLLLAGEAGIGKSRLAEEFGRWCGDCGDLFLKSTLAARQETNPYAPFIELIRALVGISLEDDEARFRKVLAAHLREEGFESGVAATFVEAFMGGRSGGHSVLERSEWRRHLLFEGVGRLLRVASEGQPLCIFLDDLQWMSSVAFDLIDYLLKSLSETRILLLGAYRTEEVNVGRGGMAHPLLRREKTWRARGVSCLVLPRLEEDAVLELCASTLGDICAEKLATRLYQESEGLPLLVVEYLKDSQQKDGDVLPDAVRKIIHYRLDRLMLEDRALLRCASLLGERFDPELLIAMVGQSPAHVLLRLTQLHEGHQLLYPDGKGRYRFTHGKVREVLLDEFEPALRRACYLAAAQALEDADQGHRERVFDLAHFFCEAGDVQRAARYHALAARHALDLQAGEEALHYARISLELLEASDSFPDALLQEVYTTAALVSRQADPQQALHYAERALSVCSQPLERADLYCLMADLHPSRLGTSEIFRKLVGKARIEVGTQTETVQMARVCFRQAKHLDLWRSLAQAREALRLFEEKAPDDPEIFRVFTHIVGYLARLEDEEGLDECALRFQTWVESRKDVIEQLAFYEVLCGTNEALGRYRQMVRISEEILYLARQIGHQVLERGQLYLLARARAWLGDFERADRHWRRSREMGQQEGNEFSFRHLMEWARYASQAGEHERALRLLGEALEADITPGAGVDLLSHFSIDITNIERIFRRADRAVDFFDYCRRFQERGKVLGVSVEGTWWGTEGTTSPEAWREVEGVSFSAEKSGRRWEWEDPSGECNSSTEDGSLQIQVCGIVGFSALTFPRLLYPLEGDFAVELEVADVGIVEADQRERLAQLRQGRLDRQVPLMGAGGLLLLDDQQNAIRLGAHIQCPGGVLFNGRNAEKFQTYGRGLLDAGRAMLRLERRDGYLTGWFRSGEGEWMECGKVEDRLGWKIRAGCFAEIPEHFYYLARRGESRFSGICFYRPATERDENLEREKRMLGELRLVLERGGKELEGELLQAVGQALGAEWGRLMVPDGERGWDVGSRWGMDSAIPAEFEKGIPSKAGKSATSEDGKIVWAPARRNGNPAILWVWGRSAPFNSEEVELVDHAAFIAGEGLEQRRLREELDKQRVPPSAIPVARGDFPHIIGRSAAMEQVLQDVERIARGSAPVLIQGESGTGKELIARAIHDHSPRLGRDFVAQNCAALPDSLLESELFGYRKGAFTGATADKPGLFEVADGGTIFLDEIADASPAVQAKLLRAVEEGEIRRVGDTRGRKVNVRITTATSRDLRDQVERGRIREDLFYRLNVVRLSLPSLRERMGDIPLLAEFFLRRICERDQKEMSGFTRGALDMLCEYPWPGNVRELQNEIEGCVATAPVGSAIGGEMLSSIIRQVGGEQAQVGDGKLQGMVTRLERVAIREALQRYEGNISQTARELGVSRQGLKKKMRRYGLME
jgi:DNA-binding NtrC family response regulator/tetratricopeptide (TPR) repeat protein